MMDPVLASLGARCRDVAGSAGQGGGAGRSDVDWLAVITCGGPVFSSL